MELKRFLEYHLYYPPAELKEKKEGKVVIGFTVTKEGKITNPRIIERLSPALDKEAFRLFSMLLWMPALQRKKEVDYEYTIDIPFKVSRYKKSLKYRGDISSFLQKMEPDTGFTIHEKVDKQARYLFGNDSLAQYMSANFQYPDMAKLHNIEGTVYLNFVVEPNGYVSNIKVEKGLGGGCSEEAVRLVGETKWKPAEKNGKRVRSRMVYPVQFTINNTFRDNSASEQK